MAKKTRARATSVGQTDASPKLDHQTKQEQEQESVHVATDYFEMKHCLGDCGKMINIKAPWGRFANGSVCGATCNQTVLNHRTEEMFGPHH